MRQHKYKVLLMSAIICGCVTIPLFMLTMTFYGDSFLFDLFMRISIVFAVALFVLIVYMARHKDLMIAEFHHATVTRLTYIERRTVETPDLYKASCDTEHCFRADEPKSLNSDEYTIPMEYLYRLFTVDSMPWNYTTYAALDIRNGKPYRMIKKTLRQKNVYGADLHTNPIDYDEVRRLALRANNETDFSGLNENTWESFIPEDKRFRGYDEADNRVELTSSSSAEKKLSGFFHESRVDYTSHKIVYLRETDKGPALFAAEASDGTIGLKFEFDFTEQMIADVLNQKYGNRLYAADRLLTDREAAFVRAAAAEDNGSECENPECVLCYMYADGQIDDGKTLARQKLADTLGALARYGSK